MPPMHRPSSRAHLPVPLAIPPDAEVGSADGPPHTLTAGQLTAGPRRRAGLTVRATRFAAIATMLPKAMMAGSGTSSATAITSTYASAKSMPPRTRGERNRLDDHEASSARPKGGLEN